MELVTHAVGEQAKVLAIRLVLGRPLTDDPHREHQRFFHAQLGWGSLGLDFVQPDNLTEVGRRGAGRLLRRLGHELQRKQKQNTDAQDTPHAPYQSFTPSRLRSPAWFQARRSPWMRRAASSTSAAAA